MNDLSNKPTIIASSMTGLLISHSLSKNKIPHILIGGNEPDDLPRLGESMNELASLDFWVWLEPEFRKYFYTKSHICLFNGDIASMIHIADPTRCIEKQQIELKDAKYIQSFNSLIHVDRDGLDRALYHKVKQSQYCAFIHCPRSKVVFSEDQVKEIHLDNEIIYPSYVFDATGPFGIVAREAGIGLKYHTNPQRVVWTHFVKQEQQNQDQNWWQFGTNLLKLDEARDGYDGISWLIPLGENLSVGVSVNPERYTLSNERIMEGLVKAYAARGVDIRSSYPISKQLLELKHQYFIRDRSHGENWVLAGGGYMQGWFPSSAGLSLAMTAAHLAPMLIKEPLKYGKVYEQQLQSFIGFHKDLDEMIEGEPFRHMHQAYDFWSRWLAYIPKRLSNHIKIYNNEIDSKAWKYRLPSAISTLSLRFRFLQFILWGFLTIRASKGKVNPFPGYFHAVYFRAISFIKAWPIYAKSKINQLTSRV